MKRTRISRRRIEKQEKQKQFVSLGVVTLRIVSDFGRVVFFAVKLFFGFEV